MARDKGKKGRISPSFASKVNGDVIDLDFSILAEIGDFVITAEVSANHGQVVVASVGSCEGVGQGCSSWEDTDISAAAAGSLVGWDSRTIGVFNES